MRNFYLVLIVFAALFLANISFAGKPQEPPIIHGTSTTASGIYQDYEDPNDGGVFSNSGELIVSTDTIFFDNETIGSFTFGGAIYADSGSTTTIKSGVKFTSNTASGHGGAIYNEGKMAIEDGVDFSSNTAGNGGAIYNGSDLIMEIGEGVIFSSNTAIYDGGAVLNLKTMTIGNNVCFSSNTAQNGGAVFSDFDSIMRIGDGVKFSSNTAQNGGAIFTLLNSTMTIGSKVLFSSNTSHYGGGAIRNGGYMTISSGAVFESNTSEDYGGGAICNEGKMTIGSGANFISNNSINESGGAIYNEGEMTIEDRVVFFSNTGGAIYASPGSTTTIGSESRFISNNSINGSGGAICLPNSFDADITMTISSGAFFDSNSAVYGGAVFAGSGSKMVTIGSEVVFTSNTASQNGGAICNIGFLTIEDGALFTGNEAAESGGAIFNTREGTLNLRAETKNIEFNGNKANGVSNAVYDHGGKIFLYAQGADIIFNDSIASFDNTSELNINFGGGASGKVILNEDMSGYTGKINLYSGLVELGEKGEWFIGDLYVANGEINLSNNKISNHNFKNLKIDNELILSVDADLQSKKMDTIEAETYTGTGTIKVKAVNILKDSKKAVTDINFTGETLKEKVESVNVGYSALYEYEISYAASTGKMKFTRTGENPLSQGSSIINFGIYSVQNEILNQVFSIMAGGAFEKRASLRNNLYVSADRNRVFSDSSLQRGVWISPYIVKDTMNLGENVKDVENSAYGILAGVDLVAADDIALSLYCGYNAGEQEYDDVNMNQTGYIFGASGIILKGDLYIGAAANVIINNNEAKSTLGTSEAENIGYSIGLKGGYDIAFGNNWTLEPNLILMYAGVSASEYTNALGHKVEDEGINSLLIKPGVKAKVDLKDGWQPYGLIDVSINTGESETKVAGTEAETMKLDPYFECALGVSKDFTNTPWSAYAQVTGKAGSRAGAGVNLGVKYAF